ncbi:hypothetical protein PaeCFBP13512_14550 [Paenibacillus sp. CFBP13512]|uniref:DUF4430 domain-containing protein n=1 Tax=Paenibacillus sp. CFBP13512 TaxID=2184007 RepID=UPI0010BFA359|nr:DUF4430 domain-containing protein [Paenibacillus sp. CFBP13512]TKJ89837.1 hypothetical protein PaeCFBP13512_14550 [Paenibacillus sp. CFBP13512]
MNQTDTEKDTCTERKQLNDKNSRSQALFNRSGKRYSLSLAITAMVLTLLLVSGCSSTAPTNPSSAIDSQTTATTDSPATSDSASSQEATIDKGTDSQDSSTESTPKDATGTQVPTEADTTHAANDQKENTNDSSSSASTEPSSHKSSASSSASTKESTENAKEQTPKTNKESTTKNTTDTTKDKSTATDKPSSKPSTSTTKPSTTTPKESGSSAPAKTPPVSTPQPQASTATLSITGDSNILGATAVPVEAGESALDLLKRVTRSKGIPMEYQGSSGFAYVEGIDNLYEFDEGPTSGWMFKVNGNFPNMSAGAYKVQVGDRIDWLYTTDLGKDVGAKN